MFTALTIAGSDSSGGAGIQADIKTMTAHGIYAMSVITALTAQNTLGVSGIETVSPDFVKAQMDAVFNDIYPDAVKIGMLSGTDIIRTVSESLIKYKAKNVVLDPVMTATSGSVLTKMESVNTMKESLFPLATIITPNIPEAELLTSMKIDSVDKMIQAGQMLYDKYHVACLIKGGHSEGDATDILVGNMGIKTYTEKRIDNDNTHGTGCTLSSAIASNLAMGMNLEDAVSKAKGYISGALSANLNLGRGHGPLNHMWNIVNR